MLYTYAIYNLLKESDKVLDIGGAAQPFRRADYVVDAVPYEKRYTSNAFMQGLPERFSKDTWIVQDVCEPLPFEDGYFDFVVCGHVLEDVRNPIGLVREMQRVSKRGYIEVPSRFYEQLYGLEKPGMCGASHHHWFTELSPNSQSGENELKFIFKSHDVHGDRSIRIEKPFQAVFYPYIGPKYEVLPLLWQGKFKVYEDIQASITGDKSGALKTKKEAQELGSDLFEKNAKVVVDIGSFDSFEGIRDLRDLQVDQSVSLQVYSEDRRLSSAALRYEDEIINKRESIGVDYSLVASDYARSFSKAKLMVKNIQRKIWKN